MLSGGGRMSLFRRKPIDAILAETEQGPQSLKRVLGAGDLIMLAIGAVIGAGIFGSIGSAAAGQIGPNGEVIRLGAGPALVLSFVCLGPCGPPPALCYADSPSMIPKRAARTRIRTRRWVSSRPGSSAGT